MTAQPQRVPVWCAITGSQTKLSFLLQEYTEYTITVLDFGRERTVEKRFSDFATLHQELIKVDLNLPLLP